MERLSFLWTADGRLTRGTNDEPSTAQERGCQRRHAFFEGSPREGSAAIVGSPFDVTVERIGEALGKVKRAARPALAPPVGTDSEPMMQHWPPQETC